MKKLSLEEKSSLLHGNNLKPSLGPNTCDILLYFKMIQPSRPLSALAGGHSMTLNEGTIELSPSHSLKPNQNHNYKSELYGNSLLSCIYNNTINTEKTRKNNLRLTQRNCILCYPLSQHLLLHFPAFKRSFDWKHIANHVGIFEILRLEPTNSSTSTTNMSP